MIRIQKFRFNSFEEQSYLLWREDAATPQAAEPAFEDSVQKKPCVVIDPGFDTDEDYARLLDTISQKGLCPVAALLTHAHPDHTYGVHRLCEDYDIPVYMNRGEEVSIAALPALCANVSHAVTEDFSNRISLVENSQHILVSVDGVRLSNEEECTAKEEAGLDIKVLLTPGHTAGGVCYLCRETSPTEESARIDGERDNPEGWRVLFSGDTLFAGCIGRSDLPGGDYDALMRSIFTQLLPLPGDVDVLPGHGRSTTIGDERTKNPFLLPFNEPEEA